MASGSFAELSWRDAPLMATSMKYAVVESERRYLIRSVPPGVHRTTEIIDRYIIGTRLRLREVTDASGVTRKLGHKVRLGEGPQRIACTSLYLDDAEWAVLSQLPAQVLRKRRHHVDHAGVRLAVDELADGTLLAEIDDGEHPSTQVPDWLDVIRDVSLDESWTGAQLAAANQATVAPHR
jgi:CYTH domain-containing protein